MRKKTALAALERAIAVVGGGNALAEILGVTSSAPSMWKARKNVPAAYCPAIERATRDCGHVVRCEELRPDIPWCVLRCGA